MQSARDILITTSRGLNEGIRALEATIEAGGLDAEAAATLRRESADSMARLRSLQDASGLVGETVPKVLQHLDLFMEIAASAGSAPSLSRKLLRHLLEEQLELTALVEREGVAAGIPARQQETFITAAGKSAPESRAGAAGSGGAGSRLPGDRRALTVGSLIGR